METEAITLSQAKQGERLLVIATRGDDITLQALRFGIGEGAELTVEKSIKGGPVIVVRNHLEIAIGRALAEAIVVKPI